MRRTRRRSASSAPHFALAAVLVLLFGVFLTTHALDGNLLRTGYYTGVLEHADAYDRAYSELSADPELSPYVGDLLGDVAVPEIEIVGALIGVAAPTLLESVVEVTIENIIEFMKDNEELDLGLDVTPIFGGIAGNALDLVGEFGGFFEEVETETAPDYETFIERLGDTIDEMAETGEFPPVIPTFDIPRAELNGTAAFMLERAGIDLDEDDGDLLEDVEDELADGDVQLALEVVFPSASFPETGSGAGETPDVTDNINDLAGAEFVTQVGEGDDARYILGPPPEVTRELEDALSIVHTVSWMSGWGRPLSLVLLILGLGGLAVLAGPATPRMLRWVGGTLAAAGIIGVLGWFIAWQIGKQRIESITLDGDSGVPESFQDIWRSVLDQAFRDLTPSFWVPSFIALGLGIALLAASYVMGRRTTRTA